MPYARKLASDMIERGYKSIEIVQAYMLLAYYNTPTERFEDDRTWTYIGLAIRMAVELNLWRNPRQPPDLDEEGIASFTMETVNRERTWYQIFIMDVSLPFFHVLWRYVLLANLTYSAEIDCHSDWPAAFFAGGEFRAQCTELVAANDFSDT